MPQLSCLEAGEVLVACCRHLLPPRHIPESHIAGLLLPDTPFFLVDHWCKEECIPCPRTFSFPRILFPLPPTTLNPASSLHPGQPAPQFENLELNGKGRHQLAMGYVFSPASKYYNGLYSIMGLYREHSIGEVSAPTSLQSDV